MDNLRVFCLMIILIKLSAASVSQNKIWPANCTESRNGTNHFDALVDYLQNIRPKNWSDIAEVAHALGLPLQNWRDSHKICIRGDNLVISRQSVHCFEITTITNITEQLYSIYIEAYQTFDVPNLRALEKLTEEIDKFERLDFYLLLKCLLLTPDRISSERLSHFVGVVENLLDSKYLNHKMFMVFNKLTAILYSARRDFTIIMPKLFLVLWHPFRSNLTGYALYNSSGDIGFRVRAIHKNETTKDIETKDLRMAAFVPYELLQKITESSSQKRKDRLNVQMVVVAGSKKFSNFFNPKHDSDHLIGVSIPRFCKTNNLPLLQVFFNTSRNQSGWSSRGRNFVDSSEYEESETCLLDMTPYFGPRDPSGPEEPQPQYDCVPTTLKTGESEITFHQRKHDFLMHPGTLCLNRRLQIPILVCEEGHAFDIGDFEMDCHHHPVSNHTERLYKILLRCYAGEKCKLIPKFLDYPELTYTDVKLYLLVLKYIRTMHYYPQASIDSMADVLDKGLTLLRDQTKDAQQIHFLADFLDSFLYCLPNNYNDHPIGRMHFIYRNVRPSTGADFGMVLYKNVNTSLAYSRIETLSQRNLTSDYICDDAVDVIVVLLEDPRFFSREDITFNVFIVDDRQGSKLIGIQHVSYAYYEKAFRFGVFLRSNDGSDEGEWTVIHSESEVMSVAYTPVSHSRGEVHGGKVKSFKHIQ